MLVDMLVLPQSVYTLASTPILASTPARITGRNKAHRHILHYVLPETKPMQVIAGRRSHGALQQGAAAHRLPSRVLGKTGAQQLLRCWP